MAHEQQRAYLDGQLIGSVATVPRGEGPLQAQLGGGGWRGFPSTDDWDWTPFHGRIENAVLLPGLVEPADANVTPTFKRSD
jgi:hypothetical protein